jgi:hypothetical protein
MTPPVRLRKEIEAYIQAWGRRESHGVIRRMIRPHRLYRHDSRPGDRPDRIRFAPIGWRVFLKSKSGQVMAVDAIRRNDGNYGFRFYVGEVAAHWLGRLHAMEKRKHSAGGEYEARLLIIPAVHISLLWFAARTRKKEDVFVRLGTAGATDETQLLTRKDLNEIIRTSMASGSELWKLARDRSAR